MADRYLLESGAPDGYLLEDSSGVLLLEPIPDPFQNTYLPTPIKRNVNAIGFPNPSLALLSYVPPSNVDLRGPLYVNGQKRKPGDLSVITVGNSLVTLLTADTTVYAAVSYPEFLPPQNKRQLSDSFVYPNLSVNLLTAPQKPFVNVYVDTPTKPRQLTLSPTVVWSLYYQLSGITGSASVTNGNDTVSANGTTTILGTLAKTNSDDTVSASGTTTVTGSLSKTNNDDTVSASGAVGTAITGSANITEQADTVSANGTTIVTGTLNKTNSNDTVSANGTTTITGTLSKTNGNDTVSANGIVGTPPTVTTYLPLTGAGK